MKLWPPSVQTLAISKAYSQLTPPTRKNTLDFNIRTEKLFLRGSAWFDASYHLWSHFLNLFESSSRTILVQSAVSLGQNEKHFRSQFTLPWAKFDFTMWFWVPKGGAVFWGWNQCFAPSSKAWDNPLNERLRATIDLRRRSAAGLFPIQVKNNIWVTCI